MCGFAKISHLTFPQKEKHGGCWLPPAKLGKAEAKGLTQGQGQPGLQTSPMPWALIDSLPCYAIRCCGVGGVEYWMGGGMRCGKRGSLADNLSLSSSLNPGYKIISILICHYCRMRLLHHFIAYFKQILVKIFPLGQVWWHMLFNPALSTHEFQASQYCKAQHCFKNHHHPHLHPSKKTIVYTAHCFFYIRILKVLVSKSFR